MAQISFLENVKLYGKRTPIETNVVFTTEELERISNCIIVEGDYGLSLKIKFKGGGFVFFMVEETSEYAIGEELDPKKVKYNIYKNTHADANYDYTFKLI